MKTIKFAMLAGVFMFAGALWWILGTPGSAKVEPLKPLSAEQSELGLSLRADIHSLAVDIGERNVPGHPLQLARAARFIEGALKSAGYAPESQWYTVTGTQCRNIIAEVKGTDPQAGIVVVGAHYDTVPRSPGADDNASGVAVMLSLARRFANIKSARTLRFVAFVNEEPPYFWHSDMGSLVYARKCRERGDPIAAMLSIESVGFYSTLPGSQQYPAGLSAVYPSEGNFVAFVGNLGSRPLVNESLAEFRHTGTLPSIGAALPAAIEGVGWSDHWSFWQEGFQAIEITDTAPFRNPYYHTPQDTPDRLNYDYVARFAWAMREVVAKAASSVKL